MNNNAIFRDWYQIRYYEVDSNNRLSIPALANFLQEAANRNCVKLKISMADLMEKNLSWVLMRLKLHIHELPQLHDSIEILTYPAGFEKYYVHRDFQVLNQEGKQIIRATSIWLVMDLSQRKLASVPSFISETQLPEGVQFFDRITEKLPSFSSEPSISVPFQAGWYDLDVNQHVNNVHYIRWILEAVPQTMLANGRLKLLDIMIRHECLYRQTVKSNLLMLRPNHYLHSLFNNKVNKELAIATSQWEL